MAKSKNFKPKLKIEASKAVKAKKATKTAPKANKAVKTAANGIKSERNKATNLSKAFDKMMEAAETIAKAANKKGLPPFVYINQEARKSK